MPQTNARLLLIDDDDATRELLSDVLDEAGFVVTAAASPAEAQEFLATQPFDLIVTDSFAGLPHQMLTATAPLLTAAGQTPTVLLTGHRPDPELAQAAGFAAVLLKPIDLDELERRLQTLLASSATVPIH